MVLFVCAIFQRGFGMTRWSVSCVHCLWCCALPSTKVHDDGADSAVHRCHRTHNPALLLRGLRLPNHLRLVDYHLLDHLPPALLTLLLPSTLVCFSGQSGPSCSGLKLICGFLLVVLQ